MKLPYEKPMVAVEDFVLSQSISACNIKIAFYDDACVMNDSDVAEGSALHNMAMFGAFLADYCAADAADEMFKDMDGYDGICYHSSIAYAFTS